MDPLIPGRKSRRPAHPEPHPARPGRGRGGRDGPGTALTFLDKTRRFSATTVMQKD